MKAEEKTDASAIKSDAPFYSEDELDQLYERDPVAALSARSEARGRAAEPAQIGSAYASPITHHPSPITHHPSPVTHHGVTGSLPWRADRR
jgi:hypothetical protein